MSYPYVLSLIDADLDRLQRARELLTTPAEPLPSPLVLNRILIKAAAAKDKGSAPRQVALAPPSPERGLDRSAERSQPAVTHVPSRRQRQSRTNGRGAARSKSGDPGSAEISALQGKVPAGPVYVSAGKLREAKAQRVEAEEGERQSPNITAEMLAQRWLRSTSPAD